MSRKTCDISVIICTYTERRWEDLLAAVDSVRKQTLAANEIIVVVDHNPQMLRRVQEYLSDVIAIENKEQRGLSGARNSGIARAQGSLIAFLDDDASATLDWLRLLQADLEDPQVRLGAPAAVHDGPGEVGANIAAGFAFDLKPTPRSCSASQARVENTRHGFNCGEHTI